MAVLSLARVRFTTQWHVRLFALAGMLAIAVFDKLIQIDAIGLLTRIHIHRRICLDLSFLSRCCD